MTDQEVRILSTIELKQKKGYPLSERETAFLGYLDKKYMGEGVEGFTNPKPDLLRLAREAQAFIKRKRQLIAS